MRRRAMRSRGSRRKSAWLNGMSSNTCSVQLTMNRCQDEAIQEYVPDLFLLIDNFQPIASAQGSIDRTREGTVVRIVGEIMLDAIVASASITQSNLTILVVNMGIYIADADSIGFTLSRDPTRDIENKDWLWKGTYTTAECARPGTTVLTCFQNDLASEGTNANGSHIDITVKRKIREQESIVLSVVAVEDTPLGIAGVLAWACSINGSVRCLVLES